MNVISLFNGMGCGWLALDKAGIPVGKRYSSEIDKYAIKVNDSNYPDTIQLGDITKWREWDIDWGTIDLVLAGSPCQGFSFAGKGLNFNDERSKLFFVFVEILNHIKQFNPKVLFLLENVQMKYEHELVISRYVGCNPIVINSALLSAQNRVRNYWTNINQKPVGLFEDMEADIPQPKDKGILLKDILENDVPEKYYLTERGLKGLQSIVDRGIATNSGWRDGVVSEEGKSTCIDANYYKGADGKRPLVMQITNHKSAVGLNCVGGLSKNKKWLENGKNLQRNFSQGERVYSSDGKSPSINANSGGTAGVGNTLMIDKSPCLHGFEHGTNGQFNNQLVNGGMIRRLTEVECERLQTVPDGYTNHVSSTQRYKMLGNGWTVDVIAYIFGFIKAEIYNVQPPNDIQCGVGKNNI